jgi:hypothetical protein
MILHKPLHIKIDDGAKIITAFAAARQRLFRSASLDMMYVEISSWALHSSLVLVPC